MINITEWSRISAESFKTFQFDSGMLVKNFNPENVTLPSDDDIICTTTGNVTATLVPTTANLGDDVNNLHVDAMELMYIQKWVATMGFTALEMDENTFKFAIGAADVTANKVTARMYLKSTDFQTITLILRLIGGGLVAVVMTNALSTAGVNITTSKDGKGNLAITMTGYAALSNQSRVPMEFYVLRTADITITAQPTNKTVVEGTATTFSVTATGTSLTYQWQVMPDGGTGYSNITGATSATLSLTTSDVTLASNGNQYRCKISDSTGYIYTESATLTVTEDT